jgi:hypothetical protein
VRRLPTNSSGVSRVLRAQAAVMAWPSTDLEKESWGEIGAHGGDERHEVELVLTDHSVVRMLTRGRHTECDVVHPSQVAQLP